MTDKYILKEKIPVPCPDLTEWAKWFETGDRIVKQDRLLDGVLVSTVFLGLDHNWSGTGEPILFETMIFGGKHHDYQTRCSTWEQAEKMHEKALELVRGEEANG